MEELQQEQVMTFCDMCGCDFDIAFDYLRCCDWSIDAAVSMYFENGGAPLCLHHEETTTTNKQNTEETIEIPTLCQHCEGNVNKLTSSTLVYKEECVYCFSSLDDAKGINICLSCYLGLCSPKHTQLHTQKTGHSIYLHLTRTELPTDVEYKEKITKLAIGVEGGLVEKPKEYHTTYKVYCEHCQREFPATDFYEEVAQKILLRSTGEKEKELFQWEEEHMKPCPHCESYQLPSPCPSVQTHTIHCADCELSRNLWLCLECGEFHCGRKQWDASAAPGNGHAMEHYQKTGHALVVKVTSIQENHADVHCYACDENPAYNYGDVAFPSIFEILTRFGILQNGKVVGLTADQQEKTLTEMNLAINQEFEFSMNDSTGQAYPIYPDGCGLENLGNTCYMNSILQLLMQMPALVSLQSQEHVQTCPNPNPTTCLTCQFVKLMDAFKQHNKPVVKPRMLKQVIGQLAQDFNNNKQQDCYEFFTVLTDLLTQHTTQPVQAHFLMKLHYRMECLECHHVDHTPSDEENCMTVQIPAGDRSEVRVSELLQESLQAEYVERACSHCQNDTVWSRMPVYDVFPDYLCIRVNRFIIDPTTYSIQKNTCSVIPEDIIHVDSSACDCNDGIPSQQYTCIGACLHRGNKADFGHYVAAYKSEKQPGWILCNDSKVVVADDAPVNECYLLFYKKCSCVCLNHSSFPAILCRGRFIVFGLTYLNLQMEHEISPEKQAALDAAQKLRDKAGEEAKLRGECFEKSKKEFESGDKGKAKELSEEGHKHDEQMKKYNKEAADAFFAAHNKGRDQMTIDLHGLYVEEAMERLKARVEAIGRKGTFIIIWGAGNHSEGGVRKIKPAVIDYLNAEKFKFEDDNPNHGCCTVFFDGKEAAAAVEPKKEVPAATETKKEVPAPSTGKKGTLPVTQTEETKKACCACCCVM